VIVSWGWDNAVRSKANAAGIELCDFRDVMRVIASEVKSKTAYFGNDTLRTVHLFARALTTASPGSTAVQRIEERRASH
jgi:hypothetical protein